MEEELKVQLAGLEKTLLETLATSTGNITRERTADSVSRRDQGKGHNGEGIPRGVHHSAGIARQAAQRVPPIAAQGSKMFFLTRDLRALNHMYQFSLNSFIGLFKKALMESAPSPELDRRIEMLSNALLRLVFGHVSRSIFNADRLTFGMHFARHLEGTGRSRVVELLFRPRCWRPPAVTARRQVGFLRTSPRGTPA